MTRDDANVSIPARAADMTSFIVMDVLERANEMEREGINVIHLEIGEPDFDTPECVKEAACKALHDGHTHYTHSLGTFELREAVCEHYSNMYGVEVDPGQVVITGGTSPAMLALFGVLLDRGDRVDASLRGRLKREARTGSRVCSSPPWS